jgi:hypothetical protein
MSQYKENVWSFRIHAQLPKEDCKPSRLTHSDFFDTPGSPISGSTWVQDDDVLAGITVSIKEFSKESIDDILHYVRGLLEYLVQGVEDKEYDGPDPAPDWPDWRKKD